MAVQIVHCSFCRKSQEEVRKVVAGPDGVYICDECVGLAAELVGDESGAELPTAPGPDAS